jgi:hypothetical protein
VPETHARRAARHLLKEQQNRFSLLGCDRETGVQIAQPGDVAELAMLAQGN